MLSERALRVCSVLAVCVLLASVRLADAADPAVANRGLDALVQDAEIARHEHLLETRRDAGVPLAPFESDGCSGGLSAGWAMMSAALPRFAESHGELPPWEDCCVDHDRAYHSAGPADDAAADGFTNRRRADENLRQCVLRVGADRRASLMAEYGLSHAGVDTLYAGIADVMYRAVRLGGVPCSGLSWRWGFGWPSCR